ncbi:MAG: response regulator [Candidatus Omnitrophota bacterium]|nr:MAG: response regulator [Candidatus Omnitrophota bacterium]
MENEMFKYVLVMDSDLERRNTFYNVLAQSNYKVTTVPSYSELIVMIKKESPSYIVMDMDTLDSSVRGGVLKKLKEIDDCKKILVLVSGLRKAGVNVQRCIDDKIILLNKDIGIQQLLQSILEILKEKVIEKDEGEISFKGNILIVDDEQDSVNFVKKHLTRRGYTVDSALSGEEAVLKVKVTKPKVVILDILMPGMDGLMILSRIKEIDSSIFVVITTALQNEKIVKEANKLGAGVYLTKPFNLSKLEAAILASELGESARYLADFL